jgi:FtsP/CotA-like multicopper oxidase with cupredoxin domain
VIRSYDFTISRGFNSADGFNKSVMLINNRFPGPLIEANWGDTIQVKVTNDIRNPEEGTSLHWHGLPQKLSPWYDGVPSVSQCPIAPGSTFTYNFTAETYGTSWYHSHLSAQYIDGIIGPLVIYGLAPTFQKYLQEFDKTIVQPKLDMILI